MTYRIYDNMEGTGFVVEGPDGMLLCTPDGTLRVFSTRNSARKRIARERSGNFHK
jgi:hypothetical protein